MRLLQTLFFSLLFFVTKPAEAQTGIPKYTVKLGSFINPSPVDFDRVRSLGFLFTQAKSSNYTDVLMGGYTSRMEAQKVAQNLQSNSFNEAFVLEMNADGGQMVAAIQLKIENAAKPIDWSNYLKLDNLYVLLNGKQVKIVAGPYKDLAEAKTQLAHIKSMGFKDAFVKNVNNVLLHKVTSFETGGQKRPLIPLNFKDRKEQKGARTASENPELVSHSSNEQPPFSKSAGETKMISTAAYHFKAELPKIRSKIKRTSAYKLQEVLKNEGASQLGLDGYYGKKTSEAFTKIKSANRQLQKYKILSQFANFQAYEKAGRLQSSIDDLWNHPAQAIRILKGFAEPLAKAYRAYFMFASGETGQEVNELMNAAVKEAFAAKKPVNLPQFDYTATYSYNDLNQLLLHLRYIYEISDEKFSVPCWLFQKHPASALHAFGHSPTSGNGFRLQDCAGFWSWEDVQILHAIAKDLDTDHKMDDQKVADSRSALTRLYLAPNPPNEKEQKVLENWNSKLWKGLDGWALRDPLLAEINTALKIAFFQTEVLFEDYFMNQGFTAKEAKGLALAALKALTGNHLNRFV